MAPVPPGDKTGYYHILVANLPWSCTWQKLKDFARNHPDGTYLNVDHAHVYPGSNSSSGQMCSGYGWVRIIGKTDFKKSLAHLNGGVFENRPLMADGRNETETTHLRDIALTKQCQTRNQQGRVVRTGYTAPSPLYQYSSTSPLSATYGEQETCENLSQSQQQLPNVTPLSLHFSASNSFYNSPPPPYDIGPGVFHAPTNQEYYTIPAPTVFCAGNMTAAYPCLPSAISYTSTPSCMSANFPPNASSGANFQHGIVQPEARKIIITRLSHDIKDADLNSLVRRISSMYRPRIHTEKSNPIHTIELPRYADGKIKGHAFVVYETQALAEHAVATLNGMKFQSRSLSAKLAKEGVDPVGGYGISESCWSPLHKNPINDQPAKEGSSGMETEVQVERSRKENRSEKEESNKGREKEREGKEDRQPLVVDGSGGGRKRQ